MGTQEGDRDWVAVANDLLTKCNINLQTQKLSDCNSNVFISLYQTILGEKVPDFIASPRSQEDDAHNVQSVIDSLSLDYLQISLSHITGENVVSGEHESIKNLLEIFDGLLEYLHEEIQEDSGGGEEIQEDSGGGEEIQEDSGGGEEIQEDLPVAATEGITEASEESCDVRVEQEDTSSSHGGLTVSSSERHMESVGGEASEVGGQASEVGGDAPEIGVPAGEDIPAQEVEGSPVTPDSCPSARPVDLDSSSPTHTAVVLQPPVQCDAPPRPPVNQPAATANHSQQERVSSSEVNTCRSRNGSSSPHECESPGHSERSSRRAVKTDGEKLESTRSGPNRVLFRTQPDVLFLELQEDASTSTPSPPPRTGEGREEVTGRRRGREDPRTDGGSKVTDSLTRRREKNKKAEKELLWISDKLSNRIEALDQMLKRVLDESGEVREVREVREVSEVRDDDPSRRPSTAPEVPQPDDETEAQSLFTPDRTRERLGTSARKHRRALLQQIYEDELRRYECEELDLVRLRAQEAEREYREAILKDVSRGSRSSAAKTRHKTPPTEKKKKKEVLPLLLEELPHLHISSQALGHMWQKQTQHLERLTAAASPRRRHRVSGELQEAQRKHELLQALVQKQQVHRAHLRDVQDQVQQQKLVQSRLRDQRQQVARAKKYHQDFHVQHRARLMKTRTHEERMFQQMFEEGLQMQKMRLNDQRLQLREEQQEQQRRQREKFMSLENYYKDQFSMLAEKVQQERQENQVQKRAQEKALMKMERELRSRMEREIRELQQMIVQDDRDDHFQALDVQRLRGRLQLDRFQNQTSFLH